MSHNNNHANVLVTTHRDIFLHDAHASHRAMRSDRISEVYASVSQVAGTRQEVSPEATREQLERVHDADYLDLLASTANLPPGEVHTFDQETQLNRYTWSALLRSSGGLCRAVNALLDGEAAHAFNVGYAGHHAGASQARGFCFVNAVAVAALHARAAGVSRVAVLDFDTHSGNGTIEALLEHPDMIFAETYQQGYPGAFLPGYRPAHILRERCNRPREFRDGWTRLLAAVTTFEPELVLVSAGFDGHRADPLGTPRLDDDAYTWLAAELLRLGAPIVATLEGGYSVPDTARCASLFVSTLANQPA